jgi:DnaJ-class molecular chaperone
VTAPRVAGIDPERCAHCAAPGLALEVLFECGACEGSGLYYPSPADCPDCQGYGLAPGIEPPRACQTCDADGLLDGVSAEVRAEVRRFRRALLGLP